MSESDTKRQKNIGLKISLKAWVYLFLSLIGLGYFFLWSRGWQVLTELANSGTAATQNENNFAETYPLFSRLLKWSRVDLFYIYPSGTNPFKEVYFQFSIQINLGMTIFLASLAGFLNSWNAQKRWVRALLCFRFLFVILATLLAVRISYVVLTTPRYSPVPVYSTVKNILYQKLYFGDAKYLNLSLPKRNDGLVIPNEGVDMHLILTGYGDFKLGNAIFTPNQIREILQQVLDRNQTARVFLWMEDRIPNQRLLDRIRKFKEEFADSEWYWVVETDSLVEGRPNILGLPYDEY